MNQEKNIDLIEQYLNNELSAGERQDLEEKISGDDSLAAEFERRQLAHQMLDFMVAENLRNQLRSLEAEDTRVIPMATRKRSLYVLAVAASVVILIGAFFFIPTGGSLSNQQLALNFYEAPAFTMRGTDAGNISLQVAQGMEALNLGEYSQAVELLQNVPADNEYYVMARYYLGHAHFLNKNYPAAESDFNQVMNANDMRFQQAAEWYRLLSCKAQNQNCQEMLQLILQNPNHPYFNQASEIQNQ